VRMQLASVLKAVISMRLMQRSDGRGRVPAVEIMISTGLIQDCIINKEKTRMIPDAIAAGISQYGMQTFDQSLFYLYKKEFITFEEALKGASNPDDFKLRVQGIESTSSSAQSQMEQSMADPFAKGDSGSKGESPGINDFIFDNSQR
jgi:twitching motility protein PilT